MLFALPGLRVVSATDVTGDFPSSHNSRHVFRQVANVTLEVLGAFHFKLLPINWSESATSASGRRDQVGYTYECVVLFIFCCYLYGPSVTD